MQQQIKNVINTLKEWIEIKSVKSEALDGAPFGLGNKIMLEKALSDAKEMGFEVKNYDGYIGEVIFGEGEDKDGIAVLCHLDVVPEGDLSLWDTPPFTLTEKDGVFSLWKGQSPT